MYVLSCIIVFSLLLLFWTEATSGFRRQERCDWPAVSTPGLGQGVATFLLCGNVRSFACDENRKVAGGSLALKERGRAWPAVHKADLVEREEIGIGVLKVK